MDHNRVAKILLIFIIILVVTVIMFNFLSLSSKTNDTKNKNATMKMLFSIFRHGSRSPTMKIPNNPNNNAWLKIGYGELTDIGKDHQILSGQLTRQNYGSFLSKSLNDSEVYVQSSSLTRTIWSAKYFISGLYNLNENEIWNTNDLFNFSPSIRVHTTYSEDYIRRIAKVFMQALKQTPISAFDKHTIEILVNSTGLVNTQYDTETIFMYADVLIAESFMNMSTPFGLEKYMKNITKFRDDVFDAVVLKICKEIAFVVINDVIEQIEKVKSGNSTMNTHVISLHDLHIATIITALTKKYIGSPPFSSTIYLEFYAADENVDTDYIMLRYRPTVTSSVSLFSINKCGYKCPYHKFKTIVAEMNSSANILN